MISTTDRIGILEIGVSWRGGLWHSTPGTPWLYWTAAARYDAQPLTVLAEIVIFRLEGGILSIMEAQTQDHTALVAQASAHAAELVDTAGEVLTLVQRALVSANGTERGTRLARANSQLTEAIVSAYSASVELGAITSDERAVGG